MLYDDVRFRTPEDAFASVLIEANGPGAADVRIPNRIGWPTDVPHRLAEILREAGYMITWAPPERRYHDDD